MIFSGRQNDITNLFNGVEHVLTLYRILSISKLI